MLGDPISTDAAGRAKLWLADGVLALLDSDSALKLSAGRIELLHGRLFVDSPEGGRIIVASGQLEAPLSASKAAFEHAADGAATKIFCAQGEVMASAGAAPTPIPSGETLTAAGGKVSVEPEKAFDDWTGGLAVPWAANWRGCPGTSSPGRCWYLVPLIYWGGPKRCRHNGLFN